MGKIRIYTETPRHPPLTDDAAFLWKAPRGLECRDQPEILIPVISVQVSIPTVIISSWPTI